MVKISLAPIAVGNSLKRRGKLGSKTRAGPPEPQRFSQRPQISRIAPRLRPDRFAIAPRYPAVFPLRPRAQGDIVSPFSGRLLSMLVGQLVPAALVTTLGVLVLDNLAKAPSTKPAPAPLATAITTEAVVRVTPREALEPQADDARSVKVARTPAKSKPVAPSPAPVRTAANEPPHQTAPLPIAPIMPSADAAPAAGDSSLMGRLRGAVATMQRIPQWTARAVSGWWPEGEPPRPPAAIPVEFQASM